MRSMLVIGLGRFGENLAKTLAELGNEVMAVDNNEANINKIAPFVTSAVVGDCMEPSVIESLGVADFDTCFVCISENFQSSLEITSLLKEMGASYVVSKADRDLHGKFLLKIGADEVIQPERDMAQRTAIRFTVGNVLNYYELTSQFAILEMATPEKWLGKTIAEVDVRAKYHVNIIGAKRGDEAIPILDAGYVFNAEENLLVSADKKDGLRLLGKL